jgi:hypothetical protein
MELISIGFLAGALFAVIVCGTGVIYGRHDNRQSDVDPDIKLCIPNRHRDRSSSDRHIEPEEVTNVLTVLRMGASAHEKEVIDYLMDRDAQLLEHARKLGVRLGGNDEDVL